MWKYMSVTLTTFTFIPKVPTKAQMFGFGWMKIMDCETLGWRDECQKGFEMMEKVLVFEGWQRDYLQSRKTKPSG